MTTRKQIPMSLDILLRDLPLRPSTLALLEKQGFGRTRELIQLVKQGGIANFAAELCIDSPAIAARIHREVVDAVHRLNIPTSALPKKPLSVAEILSKQDNERSQKHHPREAIITFCREIDQLIHGGIKLQQVTEISGAPGAGKTQLAMQLAVNAKLPRDYGGVTGDCLYVDADGSFAPTRCYEMADALVRHIQDGRARRQRAKHATRQIPEWFNTKTILEGIHVYRVHDVAGQTAILYSLEQRLKQHKQLYEDQLKEDEEHRKHPDNAKPQRRRVFPIRLIIVDSIAFHYRAESDRRTTDFVARTRQLTNLVANLHALAKEYHVAVVTLNQMTTKRRDSNSINQKSWGEHKYLVPALGMSFAHAVTTRIMVVKDRTNRNNGTYKHGTFTCHLTKSPAYANGTAPFQIVRDGIRGLEYKVRETTTSLGQRQQEQQQKSRPRQSWPNEANKRYKS